MEGLFGPNLRSKSGPVATSSVHSKYKLLYFSAHWCPPCKAFTPMLALFYSDANASEHQLEVVFVSFDRSEEQFNEYYGTMPWLALPYSERQRAQELGNRFGVQGIPALILVDQNGNMKHAACRGDVMNKGPACLADWDAKLRS
jgi:nucleoredoxin